MLRSFLHLCSLLLPVVMSATLQAQTGGLEGVRWVNRTAEFSALLGHYRYMMGWLLLAGVALVLLTLAPLLWAPPSGEAWWPLLAAGALTVAGSLSIAWAYARAEANVLVPTEYSGFVWASLFGWLFFRENVSLPTLAGTALIVTGCWLAARGDPDREKAPA